MERRNVSITCALFALLAQMEACSARAQDRTPAPTPSAADTPALHFTVEQGRGIGVSAGDAFAMSVMARVQMRNTLSIDGDQIADALEIRSLRLWWSGHVLDPHLRWLVQIALGANEFEPGSASPILDAYVETTHLRDLNVRVGQFFVPFDRMGTIGARWLQTVDRADAVRELSLARDIGVAVQSSDLFGLGGVLGYHLGVFGGDGRNRLVTSSGSANAPPPFGLLFVGRVVVQPFGGFDDDREGDLARDPRPRLMIGAGAAYDMQTDRPRSTTGTPYAHARFDQMHAEGDLVFKWAGLSVMGEVLWREATTDSVGYVDPTTMTTTTERARNAWSYVAQAGLMLGPMIEIWARWDHLEPIRASPVAATHTLAGGLNAYLNGHLMKIQADWAHTFDADFTAGTHVVRVQLDATF